MATTKAQRIGVSIILVVTVIGTLGSFAAMILGQENAVKDARQQQQVYDEYQKKLDERQTKIDTQTADLSSKYLGIFKQYESRVASFNLEENNKEMKVEDLSVGDGEEIGDDSNFAVYYLGWNPNGKIFDGSINGNKLKEPLYYSDPGTGMVGLEQGLKNASLIDGWKEGMKGMKVGGVREMTIPSDKAYGEKGQGNDIPPNTPIRFIVMAIPKLGDFPQPELPQSLLQGLY